MAARLSSKTLPRRTLLAITVGVLALHLAALQGVSVRLALDTTLPRGALVTRTIVLNPSAAAPKPAPAARPSKEKQAAEPVITAPVAMNSIANEAAPEAPAQPAVRPVAPPAPEPPPATAPEAAATETPQTSEPAATLRAAALAIPGSVELRYKVTAQTRGQTQSADGVLNWQHDGNQYSARFEVSVFLLGSRTQTSVGRLTAEGLAPTRFADKTRSEQAAHFERDKGRISFSANTPSVPLQPGAQDRLSIILQLSALLAGDPALTQEGVSLTAQVASAREAEPWTFAVRPIESVDLGKTRMLAIPLVRLPRRDFDQKIEIWFAPSQNFLPARIRLTQANGDVVDQTLVVTADP